MKIKKVNPYSNNYQFLEVENIVSHMCAILLAVIVISALYAAFSIWKRGQGK